MHHLGFRPTQIVWSRWRGWILRSHKCVLNRPRQPRRIRELAHGLGRFSRLAWRLLFPSDLGSGAFVDEYSGKPIRLQGSFLAQSPQFLPMGISQSHYIGFGMAGPGGYGVDGSGLWVDVVVPKEQSVLVFELKPGDSITIFGVAQRGERQGRATLIIMAYELRKDS